MTSELPQTNLIVLILLLIGRRRRLKVVGQSMLPLLKPGEEIVINPYAYCNSSPRVNDVVIINHPHNSQLTIVKRVTGVTLDGSYFLTGDNLSASTDSRHWGNVSPNIIIGKVTNRFA